MQYFIGIVPPEELKSKITNFQKKYNFQGMTAAVEPHLTLKAQGGLTEDKTWIDGVRKICANFSSFELTVGDPHIFGRDILYLSAQSPELVELHNVLVRTISPTQEFIKKYFELEDFTPHITLAKTFNGITQGELKTMKRLAEEELQSYPVFRVTFIRIYEETDGGTYKPYLDINLNSH